MHLMELSFMIHRATQSVIQSFAALPSSRTLYVFLFLPFRYLSSRRYKNEKFYLNRGHSILVNRTREKS
jgi:hypothetical protein